MKKILLLTDFSAVADHAIQFARHLFRNTPADFCLVNAYPLEVDTTYNADLLAETYQQYADKHLQEQLNTLRQGNVSANHTYRGTLVAGWPVGAIEAILASEPFDVVVVGATGRGNSEWLGSVATGLIRQLTTSVLVVPASASFAPISQIVLASDFQTRHPATFGPLRELVQQNKAELTLLAIKNPDDPADQPTVSDQQKLLDYFGDNPTSLYPMLDEDVLHGIDAYLDGHSVDLLVTVPHQKGWLAALLGQSVTRHLAYRPRVPLLTLHDGAGH